ncbi:aminodeoxychorismate synthase component I [Dysgonomonas massiliensis]|uniref:aminodeoxychorismate synthase component I n=1 Tax=Dysgonomonas massiliensis TaxID=2040292 RepID=UPI000C77C35F|nr:aminodeoxychorismate synthase component I [Dysgonomonas massiliensis]
MKVSDIKLRMNTCGASKTPFLFAVDFDLEKGIFIENPMLQSEVLFRTPLGTNQTDTDINSTQANISASPLTYEEYEQRLNAVMQGLMRGDSYLANLTVRTPIEINIPLADIFHRSQSPYGLYIPEQFVCFSPERFVKIANRVISTNPMKGTISASVPNAEEHILADPKETAEHCTIVDLLRNDLGIVATDIQVERFRYIDRISTQKGDILQVSSEITGKLSDDYQSRLGDIIFGMLPAGSICGAPKRSTVEIIHRAEPESRGYYTGVFGYFDGEQFDSAVMIRFIQQEGDKFFFHSGGGITVNSQARDEYEEVLAKIYLPIL